MPNSPINSPLVYSHGDLAAALSLSERQLQARLDRLYAAHFPRPLPMISPARWSRAQVRAWIDAAPGGNDDAQ